MKWNAAIEQQEEALARVFLMLIAMTLMSIRAVLVARADPALLRDEEAMAYHHNQIEDLLHAAEIAAQRAMASVSRTAYELVKQTYSLAQSAREHVGGIAHQCGRPAKRLDSS